MYDSYSPWSTGRQSPAGGLTGGLVNSFTDASAARWSSAGNNKPLTNISLVERLYATFELGRFIAGMSNWLALVRAASPITAMSADVGPRLSTPVIVLETSVGMYGFGVELSPVSIAPNIGLMNALNPALAITNSYFASAFAKIPWIILES